MIPPETTCAPLGDVAIPVGLRPLLLAAAVHLALSAVAHADGDRLVIRSGRAELRSTSPLEAGKIPVVFVHGMLGNSSGWSVMIDRLTADPPVRSRYQFLTFSYDSLQPIPESGRELIDTLTEMRRRMDPAERDSAFDRVVMVGHSLGGLVARSAANVLGTEPPEAVRPSPGAEGRPSRPRVGRIVFVATPHRGALVDRGVMQSVGAWLARSVRPSIAAWEPGGDEAAPRSPTSVDQLSWDHPFLRDLERSGASVGIPAHSIIATLGAPGTEGATDGLVPVVSARLRGARSELVVRAPHACFQYPEVIQEVRRVLSEHTAGPIPLYRGEPEWGWRLRELTGGRGVDRLVEAGGPGTIAQSLKVVAPGGEIAYVGFLSAENPGIDFFASSRSWASFRPIAVGDREGLRDFARAIAMSGIKPAIDCVFHLQDAKGAYAYSESGSHLGKVVIRCRDDPSGTGR